MELIRTEERGHQVFLLTDVDVRVAVLDFTIDSEKKLLTILHTGVREEYTGLGIGSKMVEKAIELAKSEGFKIKPECTFSKSYFEKHPEADDLLA